MAATVLLSSGRTGGRSTAGGATSALVALGLRGIAGQHFTDAAANTKPSHAGWVPYAAAGASGGGGFGYVFGLRAFLSLHDLEFHGVTLLQALVALGLDGAVVNEDVGAVV